MALGGDGVLLSLKAESQEVRLQRPEARCLTSRQGTDTQTHIDTRTLQAAPDCEYTHTHPLTHTCARVYTRGLPSTQQSSAAPPSFKVTEHITVIVTMIRPPIKLGGGTRIRLAMIFQRHFVPNVNIRVGERKRTRKREGTEI